MTPRDLSPEQLAALIETRDPRTGLLYPPAGLQPYHDWLIQTLRHLSDTAASDLRVSRSDVDDVSCHIAPGRASVAGAPLHYAGGTLGLGAFNNDTALVWLEDNAGEAEIGSAALSAGWPGGSHLKLATIVLSGGAITEITDLRFQTMLSV